MRLRKVKREYGCRINVAALIDVVFLLIIFFMTVSQFQKFELQQLDLPKAQAAENDENGTSDKIIINVLENENIMVGGVKRNLTQLKKLLTNEIARTQSPTDMSILIRGDRSTAWKTISQVMQLSAKMGITKVKVAVRHDSETSKSNSPQKETP